MLLSINPINPQARLIQQVVNVLNNDGVIIYPTDTVYGLGCSIFSKKAMKRLQQIKNSNDHSGMNPKKPLTFICANQTEVQEYTQGIPTQVFKLLRRKLPGPYTFVFKAAKIVPKMMLTPRSTVGLRWPNHPIANEIVKTLGHPILSISLRISEDELYDDPHELHEKYKNQVDLIVDGGTIFAENSTIIDFSHGEVEIVRMGKGPVDWLKEV
ncbi:MAG: threonylcarbamoyl-AMP synthase [Deltaproteobacteria bacterium]|mgnify:FL=1|jgi:tRNA threonylcarbamoyl adenosine modification protein (Sua5/YciO/YrdC/YwlC family)|nr:threonylcarbamoyl-AMP synthase [Deltaproteobacteria bacterium]MBT4015343.1 threonylcarbamoyl-AMP synthase [Deltaproteobacteria bacterium]MBT4184026.1 threonylcarbamoyl-AMP synthase [Deltaproteobacteria bacterium]MBT4629098.1 threonylcarbamoyl-AMP synthase [Deltaproteobacteria bacterium]MBT5087422.1 threonylcarbamoyl-AMP synthase [Deltaproteobacteria bacterium]